MKRFSIEKYPSLTCNPNIRSWLTIQSNLGLAENTLSAYARAMEDYLRFSIGKHCRAAMRGRNVVGENC